MDKPHKLSVQGSFAVLLIFTYILDKGNMYDACKTQNMLPNLKSCLINTDVRVFFLLALCLILPQCGSEESEPNKKVFSPLSFFLS
jgi:hypothetical protein